MPVVEVAAYAGHSTRLPQGLYGDFDHLDNTTTRVYQHPTGRYREHALAAIEEYLAEMLAAASRGRRQAARR